MTYQMVLYHPVYKFTYVYCKVKSIYPKIQKNTRYSPKTSLTKLFEIIQNLHVGPQLFNLCTKQTDPTLTNSSYLIALLYGIRLLLMNLKKAIEL